MKFLLDENFPKAVIPVLEKQGHQVIDFRRIGVEGSPDEEVVRVAIENSAAILTTDRDFFHTLGKDLSGHYGIIVIALKQPSRNSIIHRIEWFLENIRLESLSGRAFQLRDQTWMVYPPLED